VTKIVALTAAIKALSNQMVVLTTKVDETNNNNNNNNRNNPNRGGGLIPVIKIHNNNHITYMYRKSEHIRESDLE